MQRVCFTLRVKPDRLAEYRESHKAVWPEMLAALSRHGWTNYSIFLREDGRHPRFKAQTESLRGFLRRPRWRST